MRSGGAQRRRGPRGQRLRRARARDPLRNARFAQARLPVRAGADTTRNVGTGPRERRASVHRDVARDDAVELHGEVLHVVRLDHAHASGR
jgi:hypothetical protein